MDKQIDIERAWKDEEYRSSLTPEQLAQLPHNLTGELSEEDLENTIGGTHNDPRPPYRGGALEDYKNAVKDYNNALNAKK
jgi:mersacidin/lichenicidin family type 2 lantibiotic